MRTNTFIKALAFAMLLATACNKNEIANDENTDKKGFSFPVTVNVTREGDDATKATFNDGTKKLSFSEGDILFVGGRNTSAGAGYFDGALDYDAVSGKFSGTITTQFEYTGTADELFTAPNYIHATLLPKGYEDYGYLSSINQRETAVLYRQAVVVAREGVSRTIASRCVLSSNELIINNFPLRTLRFKQTSYAA